MQFSYVFQTGYSLHFYVGIVHHQGCQAEQLEPVGNPQKCPPASHIFLMVDVGLGRILVWIYYFRIYT